MRKVSSYGNQCIFSRISWSANCLMNFLIALFVTLSVITVSNAQNQSNYNLAAFDEVDRSIEVSNQFMWHQISADVQDVVSEKSDDEEEKRLGHLLVYTNSICPKGALFSNHSAYTFTKLNVKLYVLFHSWKSFSA